MMDLPLLLLGALYETLVTDTGLWRIALSPLATIALAGFAFHEVARMRTGGRVKRRNPAVPGGS
jgi:hypothetical protein